MKPEISLPPTSAKTFLEISSTSVDDYFPGAPPVYSRWATCEEEGLERRWSQFSTNSHRTFSFSYSVIPISD